MKKLSFSTDLRSGFTELPFTTPRTFKQRPPRQWIVDGLIAADEASVVFGAPEAGKSNFATYLACCAASARPVFGRDAGAARAARSLLSDDDPDDRPSPCGVLYLALERVAQVERRIRAFISAHNIRFSLPIAVAEQAIDLREKTAGDTIAMTAWRAAETAEAIDGYKAPFDLVIIDTLARGLADGNDSDPVDIGAVIATIDRVRELLGAHVMVVHHTPLSDPGRMRGHTSLLGAIDLSIAVTSKGGNRVAAVLKNSDGPEKPRFAFTLRNEEILHGCAPVLVEGAVHAARDEDAPEEDEPSLTSTEEAVLAALSAVVADAGGEPVDLAAWRSRYAADDDKSVQAGTRRTRFSRAKSELLSKGFISEGEAETWSVTEMRHTA